MKMWNRVSRGVRTQYLKYKTDLIRWALALKPGDLVATCDGWNRIVASIEPVRRDIGEWNGRQRKNSWILCEVEVTDTTGETHICPGGGCVMPPETAQEIEDSWLTWYTDEETVKNAMGWSSGAWLLPGKWLKEGKRICDERGLILPELDSAMKAIQEAHREAQRKKANEATEAKEKP